MPGSANVDERTRTADRPPAQAATAIESLADLDRVGAQMEQIGRDFHGRGWVLGRSGNFSAVISRQPLRVAITATGASLGALEPDDVLLVDARGRVVQGNATPSAELPLHLAMLLATESGALLHTHSTWATVASAEGQVAGAIELQGYEMLKGLPGVTSHLHRERVPVIENSQSMDELSAAAIGALGREPGAHGLLVRRHGLYAWGANLSAAQRSVECFEFLFEVRARSDRRARESLQRGDEQWQS